MEMQLEVKRTQAEDVSGDGGGGIEGVGEKNVARQTIK